MSISAKYYNLGIELGLHPGKLEAIKQTHSNDVAQALTQVLLLWLKRQYDVETHGPPTWQKLREAVDSPSGGDNPALAEEIAEKNLIPSMSHSNLSLSLLPSLSLLDSILVFYIMIGTNDSASHPVDHLFHPLP